MSFSDRILTLLWIIGIADAIVAPTSYPTTINYVNQQSNTLWHSIIIIISIIILILIYVCLIHPIIKHVLDTYPEHELDENSNICKSCLFNSTVWMLEHCCVTYANYKSTQVGIQEGSSPQRTTQRTQSIECVICLESDPPIDHMCIPCGHKCGHRECLLSLSQCPICRQDINSLQKVIEVGI